MKKLIEVVVVVGKCLINKDELKRFEEQMGA